MKNHTARPWAFLILACVVAAGAASEALGGSPEAKEAMSVSDGKEVSIEYTLTLEDKSVVDTNVGGEPLTYTHGASQIIPGLEHALEGMKKGDSKKVTVQAEEGYGPIDEKAFMEVSREQIPADAMEVGAQLQGTGAHGMPIMARITEIKEKTVVLDMNHPLAGKTLYFDVKILGVRETSGK